MKIKTYKVEFYQDENNNLHCERENDGFNSLEILGMLEETKIQIIRLMNGEIKIPIENTKISSVQKDRITIDYVINKKWNKFFRKMIRTIIIRTISNNIR